MIFAVLDPSPLTVYINCSFLLAPYGIGQAIILLPCGFFFYLLLSIFLFFLA